MAEKQFDNVKINVGFSEEQELKELKSGEGLSVLMGKLAKAIKDIISHIADGVKHISAEDRVNWNGKANGTHGHSAAEISGLPSSLPANGGNADTVDGYTSVQLIQSNINLFDNADFRINQRGMTEYAFDICVDRWHVYNGSCAVVSNGLDITTTTGSYSALYQYIDFGKEQLQTISNLTFSYSDGVKAYSHVFDLSDKDYNSDWNEYSPISEGVRLDLGWKAEWSLLRGLIIFFSSEPNHVSWAKLEPGSIVTPFIPPISATELLKCQKYYQIRSTNDIQAVDLRPTMRTTPTVTAVDGGYAYDAEP